MFKNILVYRLTNFSTTPEELAELLAKNELQPTSGLETHRFGWVRPKEHGEFVHKCGKQLMITLGSEKKLLPASVVNQFTKIRAQEIEEQQGHKPGRKQMKQIKEAVTDELLPRAFAIRSRLSAWIDPESKLMVIDAGAIGKADGLIEALIKCTDKIGLAFLRVNVSPSSAMTAWLAGGDLASTFTVDRDCELCAAGEEKATVRYVRHTLEAEEITKHIAGGKAVTKLAMTWRDRISFVLHDNLQIKRINVLGALKADMAGDEHEDAFDADFALMSGEMPKLIADLVDVLGGEVG